MKYELSEYDPCALAQLLDDLERGIHRMSFGTLNEWHRRNPGKTPVIMFRHITGINNDPVSD